MSKTKPLNTYLKTIKKPLKIAAFISYFNSFLLITQCLILALIFSDLLEKFSQQLSIDYSHCLWLLLAFMLVYFLRLIIDFIRENISQKASMQLKTELRTKLLAKITALGPERRFYGNDGEISAQLIEQIDALEGYIRNFYVQQRQALLTPLLIVIVTFYFSPFAAGLLLVTAPLVPIFMILTGVLAADKNRRQLKALSSLSGRFLDFIRGISTLKRLSAEHKAQIIIDESAEDYRRKTLSVLSLAFLSTAVLELFASIAIALVAVYLGFGLLGILPWAKEVITVPYFGALSILLMAPEFYNPLRKLGNDYHDKAKAEAAINQLTPLLEAKVTDKGELAVDFKQAPTIQINRALIKTNEQRIRLQVEQIHIPSAQRIGIIGESGAGKSSLLEMLLRFTAYEGDVTINDQQLTEIDYDSLRANVAYLSQTPALLPCSIFENLRLADQQLTEDAAYAVLEKVGLIELVQQLPKKIHYCLGEFGKGLSGGQIQRLSLAQLLLRQANLWLIDEPTAHLDQQTAENILQVIEQHTRGKTVILISHQHSIQWLDHIYQIHKGQLI